MYEKISNKKKWSLELISISTSDAGGLKEVIASIKGSNIYSTLKYESGVHRVQRVPDTETQGRVHTSAATVAVLPEAEEVDLKINETDLELTYLEQVAQVDNPLIQLIVRLELLIYQQVYQCHNKMKNLSIKIKQRDENFESSSVRT